MNFFKNFQLIRLCKKDEIQKILDQYEGEEKKCIHCGYLLERTKISLIEQVFNTEQSTYSDKLQCKTCKSRFYIVDWKKEEMQHNQDAEKDNYFKKKLSTFFHETTIHGVKAVAHSQNRIRR